jgi:spore coat protein U-like protein
MRKRIFVSVFFVALVAMAGTAIALDTATVTVSATVSPVCMFSSPAAALAFGVLPTPSADTTVTASLNFWCTAGASYTITDDDGLNETGVNLNRMISTGPGPTNYMPYSFTYAPATGSGLGPSSPITLNLSGTVLAASYGSLPGGVYQDTVTLTINP